MARSRSIPVALLKEPDFFELSAEARVVFIGLILEADDEGRGRAHAGLLARLFNVSEAAVEEALSQLVERGLLLHYQVGRQQYYQWLPWKQWQSLSKPTPSQLPPPPAWEEQESVAEPVLAESAGCSGSGVSWGFLENPGNPRKPQSEEEGEGEGEREREEETEREREQASLVTKQAAGAGSTSASPKVVPFPGPAAPRVDSGVDAALCQEIAEILGLPASRQLCQVLEEFAATLGWSAVRGEAVECAEYIQDPRRNQRQQRLTPGFFRRWLKRVQAGQAQAPVPSRQEVAAGSEGTGSASAAGLESGRWPPRRGTRSHLPVEPAWQSDPMAQYRSYVEAQRQAWKAACQVEQVEAEEPGAAAGGS
ncbi:MAG: winged helix-turn-helix transcriptional regulator [Thermogemmatispora sp.]|uniref:winged helix-turn-helix domain-containing protein n=1 Tax=Thermogemmatispora sp. TaxID=1968838 RepID=UPI0019DDBE7A|nr:winged helix-turn-helix domain-containing protein [Thermogemmatispora sp.]MBE3566501.1 winged helix-turn-helix transcriptional regulator [Thermogemmatispora sp.]